MPRVIRNFLWWAFGFISPVLIVGVGGVVCATLIPSGTLLNHGDTKVVNDDLSGQTLLSIFKNYQTLSVGDFPGVSTLIRKIITDNNLEKYVEVDYEKLDALTYADLTGSDLSSKIMGAVKVTATISSLGLLSQLGGFANLEVINDYDQVAVAVDPAASDFVPALYYYKTAEGEYKRAFNDDKTYVEGVDASTTLYYPALKDVPLLELMNIFQPRLSASKVVDLIGAFTEVTPDSVIAKILGDTTVEGLGSLDVSTIKLNAVLPVSSDNESLYDILCSAVVVKEGEAARTPETITIGDLENISINGIKLKAVLPVTSDNQSLYDILCSAVPVGEGEEARTSDTITIGDLEQLNINNVKLKSVLPVTSDNESLYDVLCGCIVVGEGESQPTADTLTIGMLSNMNMKQLKLTSVIEYNAQSQDLYAMLVDATGKADYTQITIDDLSSIDTSNIKLSSVMDTSSDLFKVLVSATGKDADEIRVSDLTSMDINNIKLSAILDPSTSSSLYAILRSATGKEDADIQVGDLSGIDINNVKLSAVLDPSSASQLYTILGSASGKAADEIKIGDLSNLNFGNIKISSIVSSDELGSGLGTVLCQGTGNSSFDDVTVDSLKTFSLNSVQLCAVLQNPSDTLKNIILGATGKSAWADVMIGDMTGDAFNINNVSLKTIIGSSENTDKLFAVLCDATGKTDADSLNVGDLSSFNMGNIKLATVMGSNPSNSIFAALLNANPNVTVSGLSDALNTLTVHDAYCKDTFTLDSSLKSNNDVYNVSVVDGVTHYVLEETDDGDASNNYYINKNAGIWLLLGWQYNSSSVDTDNGRVKDYYPSTLTFKGLEGNAVQETIQNATIYQMIAAGLIGDDDYSDSITKLTMKGVLDVLSGLGL